MVYWYGAMLAVFTTEQRSLSLRSLERVHMSTSIIHKNLLGNSNAKNCKEPCTPSELPKHKITSKCGGVASAFSIVLIVPCSCSVSIISPSSSLHEQPEGFLLETRGRIYEPTPLPPTSPALDYWILESLNPAILAASWLDLSSQAGSELPECQALF